MSRLVYGVATNSKGKYESHVNKKASSSYRTWKNMIMRAYCAKYQANFPTYIGCSVDSDFLEYQVFAEWYYSQKYSNHGYALDKDILVPNNKVYSSDTCCFVPNELNSLLLDNRAIRGKHKQGVCFDKARGKFMASMKVDGRFKNLGRFNSELEAYQVYKKAKEAHVKVKALEWQDRIADNVFEALMNWQLTE